MILQVIVDGEILPTEACLPFSFDEAENVLKKHKVKREDINDFIHEIRVTPFLLRKTIEKIVITEDNKKLRIRFAQYPSYIAITIPKLNKIILSLRTDNKCDF